MKVETKEQYIKVNIIVKMGQLMKVEPEHLTDEKGKATSI